MKAAEIASMPLIVVFSWYWLVEGDNGEHAKNVYKR